jgi:hypothetical protein
MYLYEVSSAGRPAQGLAGLAETGKLRHFSPSEIVLTPDETRDVLRFFWPETDFDRLGPLTDRDREFAQALLLEAVDASCSMNVVENIYRSFFMKVPGSFAQIRKAAVKIARKAIEDRLFGRCKNLDLAKVRIYESIRRTIALKHRSSWEIRQQGGELTY